VDNAETREDFDAHERAQIADFRRASKFTRIVAAAFAILAIWLLFAVARRYALGAGAGMPWWQELLVYVVALQLTFAVAEIVGLALFVRHVSGPRRGMRFSPRLVRPYAMRSATSVVVAAVVALVTWGAEQRHPGWWLLGLVPVVVLAALLASNTYASLRVMYRLRRLADPRVQAVVDDVAHAAGMRAPQVLVLPASDYGGVMNAWAASSGWSRGVVVLFDTVLSMPSRNCATWSRTSSATSDCDTCRRSVAASW
jgi:Zn-dependent protease with chaperone function